MNGERLQILRMVEEGKLSAEEAAKLLEALEQPGAKSEGAKARSLRILVNDGTKTHNISLAIGMVRWLLEVPGFAFEVGGQQVQRQAILQAIDQGTPGKVFDAEDGKYRLTIFVET